MNEVFLFCDVIIIVLMADSAVHNALEAAYGWSALFTVLTCLFWRIFWQDFDRVREGGE